MRTECKDCGGPMGNSHSASYCRGCHNKRQRRYARERLEARGVGVKARVLDEDAQRRLMSAAGHPGQCHFCNEQELEKLALVYVADSDKSTIIPTMLACQLCADLLNKVDQVMWNRWQVVMGVLAVRSLALSAISVG